MEELYSRIRKFRESGESSEPVLKSAFDEIRAQHADDWLLSLEILELSKDKSLCSDIESYLRQTAQNKPHLQNLIIEGIDMLS